MTEARTSLHRGRTRSLASLSDYLVGLVRTRLWLKVLVGMVSGILVGIVLGPGVGIMPPTISTLAGNWLALPGQLFLTLIQMIVIPLVFASVIRGLAASESFDQLKKLGFRVVLYFLLTTVLAIAIGIAISLAIKPGEYIDGELIQSTMGEMSA